MTREEKERLDRIEKKIDDLLARPVPVAYPPRPPVYPLPQPWPQYPQRPWISYSDIGF